MFIRLATRAAVTTLTSAAIIAVTAGCDRYAPSKVPTAPSRVLTVTSITPDTVFIGSIGMVTIRGAGFMSGATVTLGEAATNVTVVDDATITALAPAHDPGIVDALVTNPGGESARLTGALKYVDKNYSLTPGQTIVAAGDALSVHWTAPAGALGDWIGLFRVGGTSFEPSWWSYTEGKAAGTLTLSAPAEAGEYEFRYLLDDGFVSTARSSPATVK